MPVMEANGGWAVQNRCNVIQANRSGILHVCSLHLSDSQLKACKRR